MTRLLDSIRIVAVALVAAAIAASCASAASTTTAQTDTATIAVTPDVAPTATPAEPTGDGSSAATVNESTPAQVEPVDLDELEVTSGPGSLAIAANALLPAAEDFGPSWLALPGRADEQPASCHYSAPSATAARSYADIPTPEQLAARPELELLPNVVTITVEIHDDAAGAMARAAGRAGEPGRACLVEMLATLDPADINPTGFFEISTDDPEGRLTDPAIDHPNAGAWRGDGRISGPGFDLPLIAAEEWIVEGRIYISIATQALGDPTESFVTADTALGDLSAIEVVGDTATDRAIEVMRRVVATELPEAPFFTVTAPALLQLPNQEQACDDVAPGASKVEFIGPSRSTISSSSVIVQLSNWMSSDDTARIEVAAVTDLDDACLLELLEGIPGELELVERTHRTESAGGHEITVADLRLVQTVAAGSNEVIAELRWLLALTTVDSFVTGWQFLGLAGDEPDIVALAVDSADRLVAAIEATAP